MTRYAPWLEHELELAYAETVYRDSLWVIMARYGFIQVIV